MSGSVRIAAERTRTKNGTARLVLVMLAAHADGRDRLAWPSQATLAALCGVTDRAVRKALRELESLGEIRVVTHGQGRASTVHVLDILAPDFEVLETPGNRNNCSALGRRETGTGVPLSKRAKPERTGTQTGTYVPIEEIEEITATGKPRFPGGSQAANGSPFAEKREAKIAPLFSANSDTANGAEAGPLGDRARGGGSKT